MERKSKKFIELIDSFGWIQVMGNPAFISFKIADYYKLEKYQNYFNEIDDRYDNDENFEETEEFLQEMMNIHEAMMEEVKKINPQEARWIEEAIKQL